LGCTVRVLTIPPLKPWLPTKTLAPDEAAKVYKRALDHIASYMNEMEAPHPMIDAMVATGSSEILC
jgi:hypothetical protein